MQRILIVGAGFAGMHAALAAARLRDEQRVSPDTLEIVVVAPEPQLVITGFAGSIPAAANTARSSASGFKVPSALSRVR